jgi:hypothetical protein
MYLRKLNQDEQSVLSRLVELCCEAYWQEAKTCRIFYDQDQLKFIAQINSNWSLIDKEELSIEDYAAIMSTLQGIFEPADKTAAEISNRVVTVTLDERSERPLMNLLLDFNGETDPAHQVLELTIEDLIYNEDEDAPAEKEEKEKFDSLYLN